MQNDDSSDSKVLNFNPPPEEDSKNFINAESGKSNKVMSDEV